MPGWSKEVLDRLTHVGATWDQFDDFFTIMGNTSASPAPDARSIRGTGSWKPNPDLLVFVDLDGVVSPITLRESDSRFAPLDNDPLIRSDAPPDTGWDDWTNEMMEHNQQYRFLKSTMSERHRIEAILRREESTG